MLKFPSKIEKSIYDIQYKQQNDHYVAEVRLDPKVRAKKILKLTILTRVLCGFPLLLSSIREKWLILLNNSSQVLTLKELGELRDKFSTNQPPYTHLCKIIEKVRSLEEYAFLRDLIWKFHEESFPEQYGAIKTRRHLIEPNNVDMLEKVMECCGIDRNLLFINHPSWKKAYQYTLNYYYKKFEADPLAASYMDELSDDKGGFKDLYHLVISKIERWPEGADVAKQINKQHQNPIERLKALMQWNESKNLLAITERLVQLNRVNLEVLLPILSADGDIIQKAHMIRTWLTTHAAKVKQVARLDLSNTSYNPLYFNRIPHEIFHCFSHVKDLVLYANNLTVLPRAIKQLTQLQKLNVSSNQLSTLSEELFDQLPHLKELRASNNCFKTFPSIICRLSNLELVDLSLNQGITSIPADIVKLNNLKTLKLACCPIKRQAMALPPQLTRIEFDH
jgi:hypothetical protein